MAKRQPPNTAKRYLILPTTGIEVSKSAAKLHSFFEKLQPDFSLNPLLDSERTTRSVAKVIDSVSGNGAKLVELSDDALVGLRAAQPGIRIVPEVLYYPQVVRHEIADFLKFPAQTATTLKIKILSAKDNSPVAGAKVVAFTNFAQLTGVQGVTNAKGEVSLKSGAASLKTEYVFIYPKLNFWSGLQKNATLANGSILKVQPIDLNYKDGVRNFYGKTDLKAGTGVKVGVIDTGIGPSPDVVVAGGLNAVTGEDAGDFSDSDIHGTHVAGIIAARGAARGIAPGVTLQAYRVFGKNSAGASNFAIIKAISQAVADGCDLINMSLGGGEPDDATKDAITAAYEKGTIAFVATGNDNRQPVSFPASFTLSKAVTAMGRRDTFPAGTTDDLSIAAPFGTDRKNFIAAFSNIGPDVDFTAPGVGIISTVPGGYATLSGTSMACPAATGMAARLLATQPAILKKKRDGNRSAAMLEYVASKANKLGFGATFEGNGILL